VFAISTAPQQARANNKQIDQIVAILARTIELLETEVARGDVREARLINAVLQILDNARRLGIEPERLLDGLDPETQHLVDGKRRVPLTVIAPRDHIESDPLEFDPGTMRALVDEGALAAETVLDRLGL
jgi:hypothetical protein